MSKQFSVTIPDQMDAEVTSSFNQFKDAFQVNSEEAFINRIVADWFRGQMMQKSQQSFMLAKQAELDAIK